MHAVAPRLVARRGHDAPALGRPAHHDGPAGERRVVALLDGRVERVHVDVEDQGGTVLPALGEVRVS